MSATLPELPPELAGWRWGSAPGGDRTLIAPDGTYTTRSYRQARRAIVDALAYLHQQTHSNADARMTPDHVPELVPLALLDDNPFQTRQAYDPTEVEALAASIVAHGLLQLPVGRRTADGRVQLAFAHKRRRAYDLLAAHDAARWGTMPVHLRALDDETMALHCWSENKDRSDLTAVEEARAIARYTQAFGWSQQRAAEKLGLDRSTIANKLRLLRLPQRTLDQLSAGELSERQAAALIPLTDLPADALERPLGVYVDGRGYIRSAGELIAFAATLDSGRLRAAVEKLLGELAPVISKEPWYGADWHHVEGVVAPLCKACPSLLAGGRCADAACQGRKAAARQEQQAGSAAAAAGLPAKATGPGHRGYDDLSGVTLAAIRREAEGRQCGNLGVAFGKHVWFPHKVEGHPHCGVICAHGEGGRCACKAALAKSASAGDSEAARKKHDKRRIKEVYKEPAEAALAEALAPLSAGLGRLLLKQIGHSAESKLPADATAAQVCTALAAAIVKERIKYHYDYGVDLAKAKAELTKLLEGAGITPPWADAWPAPEPPPPADDLVAVVRHHLASARKMAGVGMARYCLGEAETAIARVASENLDTAAALEAELHQVADLLDAAEAELRDVPADDVGAQTSANGSEMASPPATGNYAQWRTHAEALRARFAGGLIVSPDAQTLEWLGGELETLAADDLVTDAEYAESDELLAQLAAQLDAAEVAP